MEGKHQGPPAPYPSGGGATPQSPFLFRPRSLELKLPPSPGPSLGPKTLSREIAYLESRLRWEWRDEKKSEIQK